MSAPEPRRRLLIIDDSETIHMDLRRILCPQKPEGRENLELLEQLLFGPAPASVKPDEPEFEVDSAYQGEEGVAKVQEAMAAGNPYLLVFLDYQMPPGWNGLETLRQLWKVAPTLQVVLLSAFSDSTWEEISQEFGDTPLLAELRKPFTTQELRQLTLSLTEPRGTSAAR
jgi:CheY-like chemotaxis protein